MKVVNVEVKRNNFENMMKKRFRINFLEIFKVEAITSFLMCNKLVF